MKSLTLDEVRAAGLRATPEVIGVYGSELTVDYLPDNPHEECIRVTGCSGVSWGPGGEGIPQDGWHHDDGCTCDYCRDSS